eukprot:CAMPEP_0201994240 /NCGR_PEP_ID=MMETSP0905-20130828/2146_1 /ASSEMBLY_ACC=CAM_ASM_000554 /TAXON_ID=420261 /ORGANISM="Thalassiosira antarctica, Strain CCMP982" /LENGTH=797 /DNA_ID=CAMNT_0048549173 /DNA_START=375 /DNA_END=2768 /DNA_ORIENTATION=-
MTIDSPTPPPPPPPSTPATPGPNFNGGGAGGDSPAVEKENYADRVRNSPGFRRRYGHRNEYNANKQQRPGGPPAPTPPPPPQIKQRLPLPKNAVLLSLIQASEPARRRAEVEAPPTPQKTESGVLDLGCSETPSPGNFKRNITKNNSGIFVAPSLPKFTRPSPLFLDGSSSGEQMDNATTTNLVGSLPDDEEHKIRVGTYLEGGPCGTYAVAVKNGLLVYPTLFEHTLPSALNGLRQEEEDVVKRDVEELVKKHRASAGMRTFPGSNDTANSSPPRNVEKKSNNNKKNAAGRPLTRANTTSAATNNGSGEPKLSEDTNKMAFTPSPSSPVDIKLGISHTWVEYHGDENFEVCGATVEICNESSSGNNDAQESPLHSPVGGIIPMMSMSEEEGEMEEEEVRGEKMTAMSDPGLMVSKFSVPTLDKIAALAFSASDEENDFTHRLSVSLTISEDDESDSDGRDTTIGASARTLPVRRSQSIAPSSPPTSLIQAKDDSSGTITKKFVRHFSQGSYPKLSQRENKKKSPSRSGMNNSGDEFDRPLIRLKYGDRVQVVSMDSRGWVKLARGYGYIRLENDKQLVKVGGTSDKACQIEAMLHELSLERNRLKHEQTKLECLSAGLMIDFQSSLITSDDRVVVPAPAGSLLRNDSELSLSLLSTGRQLDTTSNPNISLDDIDISTRSKAVQTPPRSTKNEHRLIRTAKSHSPGRTSSLAPKPKAPPSPPYGQVTSNMPAHSWSNANTPTRVNFRTGLSGHRALTSSHSHPHDFLGGSALRSMSNHAGISSSKKSASNSRGRSIY